MDQLRNLNLPFPSVSLLLLLSYYVEGWLAGGRTEGVQGENEQAPPIYGLVTAYIIMMMIIENPHESSHDADNLFLRGREDDVFLLLWLRLLLFLYFLIFAAIKFARSHVPFSLFLPLYM